MGPVGICGYSMIVDQHNFPIRITPIRMRLEIRNPLQDLSVSSIVQSGYHLE